MSYIRLGRIVYDICDSLLRLVSPAPPSPGTCRTALAGRKPGAIQGKDWLDAYLPELLQRAAGDRRFGPPQITYRGVAENVREETRRREVEPEVERLRKAIDEMIAVWEHTPAGTGGHGCGCEVCDAIKKLREARGS